MVQDLGLKCVSTIRAMAHWDSKKISPDGLNGDGMTSALSSTHFSVALTKPQIGIGVPTLSVSRLFHKLCKKWGHGWHLEQASIFSSSAHLRITGRCVKLSAQVLWLRSLSSLTSAEYGNAGLFSSTMRIQKPSSYFSVLHHDFICFSNSSPSPEIDPRPKCWQESQAILWLRWISLTNV
jgi:hypothetical protein